VLLTRVALAGSELALLANLIGYSLTYPSVRQFAVSREGLLRNRIITIVAGMGCYWIPVVGVRLLGISIGTSAGWMTVFGNWMRLKGNQEMLAEGKSELWFNILLMVVLGTGLTIVMLIKYMNASTNPLWATTDAASGGWNKTGLILAAVALAEYAYRPIGLHPATSRPRTQQDTPARLPSMFQRWTITIGFGSLVHLLQTFVSDAGTIIAWTWTGYPVKGPTLHPFAGVVIAITGAAVCFSGEMLRLPHPLLATLGIGGAAVLYTYPDWLGFTGGLTLIFYLVASIPTYLQSTSYLASPSVLGHALLVKCLLDVASVITAAYAFVPGGWLLRERTDLVLGFCMICVALGQYAAKRLDLPDEKRLHMRSRLRIKAVDRWTKMLCLGLGIVGLGYSYSKMPSTDPVPYYPEHRIFSGGIWTVGLRHTRETDDLGTFRCG
jgi:hypothetical protein